jgi:chorismate synthase
LCIAGGIALQQLERLGVSVSARAVRIGGETEPDRMESAIAVARGAGDSVGGVVEAEVCGLQAGIGGPMFGGLENRIAQIVFGIPAVKGIEFGEGFAAAELKGSENNDPYGIVDGKVVPLTNRAGGILGGISTGAPVVFRVAFKPTPSIAKEQDSVDMEKMEPAKLVVKGRHDPCVVLRAIPCVEAAAAIAVYDAVLERKKEL